VRHVLSAHSWQAAALLRAVTYMPMICPTVHWSGDMLTLTAIVNCSTSEHDVGGCFGVRGCKRVGLTLRKEARLSIGSVCFPLDVWGPLGVASLSFAVRLAARGRADLWLLPDTWPMKYVCVKIRIYTHIRSAHPYTWVFEVWHLELHEINCHVCAACSQVQLMLLSWWGRCAVGVHCLA
jgi:hypothetical protein